MFWYYVNVAVLVVMVLAAIGSAILQSWYLSCALFCYCLYLLVMLWLVRSPLVQADN